MKVLWKIKKKLISVLIEVNQLLEKNCYLQKALQIRNTKNSLKNILQNMLHFLIGLIHKSRNLTLSNPK